MTVTVYQLTGQPDFTGEVVATRPVCEAYSVPTALIMRREYSDVDRALGFAPSWRLYFCAARKNGRYEWLSFCDSPRTFASEADARAFAATWH